MSPIISRFFHIEAQTLGSEYEMVDARAEVKLAEEEPSGSSEGGGGARRQAQRFLKPNEQDGGSKEKRRVWKFRV
jgi:hypothetical protein